MSELTTPDEDFGFLSMARVLLVRGLFIYDGSLLPVIEEGTPGFCSGN